jgi:hypothetical protein
MTYYHHLASSNWFKSEPKFYLQNPAWRCSLFQMGRINKQYNALNEMKSKQAII